jgi:hypothetical protein
MKIDRFTKAIGISAVVLSLIAALFAVHKVKAQTIELQPFTATVMSESTAGVHHGPMLQNNGTTSLNSTFL